MRSPNAQPWISTPFIDGLFILSPAFLSTALAWYLSRRYGAGLETNEWGWLILVLGIDVAHVYGTLFRTYLDPVERMARSHLYWGVPLLAWVTGVLLYSTNAMFFWRFLAYLAVFHFVRQQYGFLRLYSRTERSPKSKRLLEAVTIYSATLYPLLDWHFNLPRPFQWFVQGDFFDLTQVPHREVWLSAFFGLYLLVMTAYVVSEVFFYLRERTINVPKNLIVVGTALSWYVGIVLLKGDLTFTLTNVVTHGIPYLALVWVTGSRVPVKHGAVLKTIFNRRVGFLLFFFIVLVLAFVEEGLWEAFVWRDHAAIFGEFSFPAISDSAILAWLVPLLALPQYTHYLLDGFIWKVGKDSAELFERRASLT